MGSMLAVHLLRGGLLKNADRLQLVGHGIPSSSAPLLSNRIDLLDAFDDEGVDVEVVANIEDVDGDIVFICAGVSLPGNLVDRRDWGKTNLALFEQIAEVCCRRVPDALFVVVSNPVELAVKVFSEKLGRERVMGMGAEQDSLRCPSHSSRFGHQSTICHGYCSRRTRPGDGSRLEFSAIEVDGPTPL